MLHYFLGGLTFQQEICQRPATLWSLALPATPILRHSRTPTLRNSATLMPLSQKNRLLQVTTPLGEDALVITGFRGTETISRLFSFELNLIAANSTEVDLARSSVTRLHWPSRLPATEAVRSGGM